MNNENNTYERIEIDSTKSLKDSTIYFYLKNNNFSESFIKKLRNNPNSLKLNGKYVNINNKISKNDILEFLNNPNPRKTNIALSNQPLNILYEDQDYLIINKEHNLSCMPTKSHYQDNLGARICNYFKDDQNFVLRIINRLDKETAGIVIVAKNLLAYKNLKSINKNYYAICHGEFNSKNFTIDSPILTTQTNGYNDMKRIVHNDGKRAITHVEIIKSLKNLSLINLKLETGRTHQIRVHLSSINHPLLNDTIYSNCNCIDKQNFDNNMHCFLILKHIDFIHFRTNKKITIDIDFPNDWNKFL